MAKKQSKITEISAKLAKALEPKPAAAPKAKPAAAPKDTGLGPNEAFPFGIKIIDAKGNISWERFKTAKERDSRNESVKGKRVDFTSAAAAAAAKPESKPAAAPAEPAKPAAAAAPKAKPADKAKPAAKPAAAPDTFALHLNKTGRLCIGKDASARLSAAGFAIDTEYFMAMAIEGKVIRIEPTAKATADTLTVRDGGGRPYISATKQLKPLGFEPGREALDIEAKPYGKAGLEFRLPL